MAFKNFKIKFRSKLLQLAWIWTEMKVNRIPVLQSAAACTAVFNNLMQTTSKQELLYVAVSLKKSHQTITSPESGQYNWHEQHWYWNFTFNVHGSLQSLEVF